jgi:hypothetical protein
MGTERVMREMYLARVEAHNKVLYDIAELKLANTK